MKMRVLLGALFLCYCNKVGNGWQMRMETIRQPRTRAPVPTNKINVVREPAGVECLFRRAGTMRKKQMTRIRGAWRRPIHSMRRNKRVDMESSSSLERIDLWGVEKTRQDLSLPSWACDNPEEERRLAAMKIILEKDLKVLESKTITIRNNKNGSSRNVKLVQAFPDVYSDFRMLRFLRKDKEQDPVSAAVRYREFLKWRATNNVDENVRVLIDSNPFQPPPELSAVASYLPCEFRAEPSMDGIVPVLLKVGDWDTTSITQLIRSKDSSKGSSNSLTIDSFLQYWAFMFDSLHWHLYQESMREKQMTFIEEICDLKGMTMKQFSPAFLSTVLKPWINLTQSNYPETAKRIIFLNPPKILKLVWKLVTPMVSPGRLPKCL